MGRVSRKEARALTGIERCSHDQSNRSLSERLVQEGRWGLVLTSLIDRRLSIVLSSLFALEAIAKAALAISVTINIDSEHRMTNSRISSDCVCSRTHVVGGECRGLWDENSCETIALYIGLVCSQMHIERDLSVVRTVPIAFESLLMLLATRKAIELWRQNGLHGSRLIAVLIKDQLYYFVL